MAIARVQISTAIVGKEAEYMAATSEGAKLMQSKGYSEENWQTFIAEGENHSENAWQKRLHMPLLFLLGSP